MPTVVRFATYTPPAADPYVPADGGAGVEFTIDCTGGDGLVVVAAAVCLNRLRRATYDGITMLPWHAIDNNGTTQMGWYLANPPTGVNTIRVTYEDVGSFESAFFAVLLNGVDPTAQYNTPKATSGTSNSPAITLAYGEDELSIAFCWSNVAITPTGSPTTIGSVVSENFGHARITAVSNETGTHTFSLPSSANWSVIGLSFKPVGATGNPPLPAEELFKDIQTYSATIMCGLIDTHYADWLLNGHTGTGAAAIFNEANDAAHYYDTLYGFYRFAEYLPSLSAMLIQGAQRSGDVYNDYMIDAPNTQGYKFFTHGLVHDYGVRALPITVDWAEHYRDEMAYSTDGESLAYTASVSAPERELSRHIGAHQHAAELGISPRAVRYAACIEWLYVYFDEYFTEESWTGFDHQFAPFMMGLLCRACIEDHAISGDVRAVSTIQTALDYLWTNAWDEDTQGFLYNINPDFTGGTSTEGSPDLNNLIGPAYTWLGLQLNDESYIRKGDQIFAGSAFNNQFQLGKQFNQQMQWVFEQLDWRNEFYELAAGPPRRLAPGRLRRGRRRNG